MLHRSLAALVVALVLPRALVLAQQGATFVPHPHHARAWAADVPQLLAELHKSRLGALLADEEVGAAAAKALRDLRERARDCDLVRQAVDARGLDLDPWLVSQLPEVAAWGALSRLDVDDLQRFELRTCRFDRPEHPGSTFLLLRCRPRAEGRWTALMDDVARSLDAGKFWKARPDGKFAGVPAHRFTAVGGDADNAALAPDVELETEFWLLHLPGLFAFGSGTPEACGSLGDGPPTADVGAGMEVDVTTPLGDAPGFEGVQWLRWQLRFVGAHLLDEVALEFAERPNDLFEAILAGTAPAPVQPLPAPALAQLRCSIDLAKAAAALAAMPGAALPPELTAALTKAFTGGVTLGVAAPLRGGVLPRVFVSLAIADDAALDALLAEVPATRRVRPLVVDGVPCSVLTVPDAPSGIQPTWCRLDGALHVAESAASMRAWLAARKAGGEALPLGDLPAVETAGDVVPHFELRCDQAAAYTALHTAWWPLLKVTLAGWTMAGMSAPLTGLPDPDAIAPHLGVSRGILCRDGKVVRLRQLGPAGGVHTAALGTLYLLLSSVQQDWVRPQLEANLGRAQLADVWTSLEQFHQQHERWPNDLTELFVAAKLPADALLLPGDDEAEPIPLPAGDPRVAKTSFRYFPAGAKVDADGGEVRALLIAIRARSWGRALLTTDGTTPEIWGDDGNRSIDGFGK